MVKQMMLPKIMLLLALYALLLYGKQITIGADAPNFENMVVRNRPRPLIRSFFSIPRNLQYATKMKSDDFLDDDELIEMGKRQQTTSDDYGHLRFGKRNDEFDDYGHLRFGRNNGN